MKNSDSGSGPPLFNRDTSFSVAHLLEPQDYHPEPARPECLGVVKLRRQPHRRFIRVHPAMSLETIARVVKVANHDEFYLVAPELWAKHGRLLSRVRFYLCVDAQGQYYFAPLKLDDNGAPRGRAATSLALCFEEAKLRWVRISWVADNRVYQWYEAPSPMPEPTWPRASLDDVLDDVLDAVPDDRKIADPFHPALRTRSGRRRSRPTGGQFSRAWSGRSS